MLNRLVEDATLLKLQGKTWDQVVDGFFATYLAAMLIVKLQQLKGLQLLNDRPNVTVEKFSDTMNDVNFWGRAMLHPDDPEVANRVKNVVSVPSIGDAKIVTLMTTPMLAPDQINWSQITAMLLLLRQKYNPKGPYVVQIIRALNNWDDLNDANKKQALTQAIKYLTTADQKSKLLPPLKAATFTVQEHRCVGFNRLNENGVPYRVIRCVSFSRLTEDDAGGADTSVGAIATGDSTISNAIIAGKASGPSAVACDHNQDFLGNLGTYQKKAKNQVGQKKLKVGAVRDGRVIKKRVKKFKVRKFKAPDHLRAVKKKDENDEK